MLAAFWYNMLAATYTVGSNMLAAFWYSLQQARQFDGGCCLLGKLEFSG
jgi:hypothetical protein